MNRHTPLKEDLELNQLRQTEQELLLRQKQFAEIPKKLAQELRDRECTMPPLAEIEERRRMKEHQNQLVSRGEVANVLRDQNRSLLLLFLLLAATGSLIWWGIQLMRG